MPDNVAFAFGEAEMWVRTPSGGLASQSVGFLRTYSIQRRPVRVEDGGVAFFMDRWVFASPWVSGEVETLFSYAQPIDIFVRWSNQDDNRLRSVSATQAIMLEIRKAPGEGDIEEYLFTFEAPSLI